MNNITPILAVETSGDLCSVSVYQSDDNYSEINVLRKHIHSEILLSVVDQAILNMGLQKNELKSIAVSMGPGSFTGLRIGMSIAKSIAFGLNIPLIPVPTFNAMAQSLKSQFTQITKLAVVNKVNRDELYIQKFSSLNSNLESEKICVINSEEIADIHKSYLLFGNYSHPKVTFTVSPGAYAIAKWAYIFGQDLVTFEYDYLEPNYIKNFIAKVKK